MGIRTKFNPMGGKSGKKYKAYLLYRNNAYDVYDLGFTDDIDIETTFSSQSHWGENADEGIVLNGRLFFPQFTNSSITSLLEPTNIGNWEFVDISSAAGTASYAIAGGKLYKFALPLTSPTVTQVGNLSNWTYVEGYCRNSSGFAYGIAGGELYYIKDTNYTKIGSSTNWTKICSGESGFSNPVALVMNSTGKVYSIAGQTLGNVILSSCTDISGQSTSQNSSTDGSLTSYAISSGKLMAINRKNSSQVGTLNTWTKITGGSKTKGSSNTRIRYGFGIAQGNLYQLNGTGAASLIDSGSNWIDITGEYGGDNYKCAYGITENKVYYMAASTPSEISLSNIKPKKLYGTTVSSSITNALLICEV